MQQLPFLFLIGTADACELVQLCDFKVVRLRNSRTSMFIAARYTSIQHFNHLAYPGFVFVRLT